MSDITDQPAQTNLENNTIDQQFIEFIIKSLVSNPDAVQITRRIDERGVLLELNVDPEDLGRVIGKHGATAQSIRTLLRALGTKNDARYNLKIIENDRDDNYNYGDGGRGNGNSYTGNQSASAGSDSGSSNDDSTFADDNSNNNGHYGDTYDESFGPSDEARLDAAIESASLASARKEISAIDDLEI
jgi:uncharacterized protein